MQEALRRAIDSFPEDIKVAIVATGGLSHQVHGERCGFNNTAWDREFLEAFEKDPQRLADMTVAELATLGGYEGAEVIMWLIMRGALSAQVNKLHEAYYLPSMTGIAVAVYENMSSVARGDAAARHLLHVGEQLAGLEKLEGTYPFDLKSCAKAYRLNKFLHDLIVPGKRALFLEHPEQSYARAQMTPEEIGLVSSRDWRGMLHYGVIFFMLEKLDAVIRTSNLHIYAAMRGQTLDDFLKTRNAPSAIYSVAGDADKVSKL